MIGLLAWLTLTPPLAIIQEGPTETRMEQDELKFPKLKSPVRRKAEAALLTLRRGKTKNDLERAVKILKQTGIGAVPMVVTGWRRFEPNPEAKEPEEDRRYLLESILEEILAGDYLHLAWEEVDKRTPDSARIYLTRRWAESDREDAEIFLRKQLGQSRGRVNYESARGLAWRGLDAALTPLHSWMRENWSESRSTLRADFKGVERGPLSAGCLALMDSQNREDRIAGMHLFELLGSPDQASALRPSLNSTDTSIKLAAINGLRVLLDNAPPLEKPSVLTLVEEIRKWEARLP